MRSGRASNDVLPTMTRPPLTEDQLSRGAALGRVISQSRQRAGLTQAELAVAAGVSLQSLLKLEQGHVANPGVFTTSALAQVLEEPLHQLIQAAGLGDAGQLSTLGYEGLDINSFLDKLDDLGVEVVADVRLNPLSRKPGFSKTKLDGALRSRGIDYFHYKALGNPRDNRAAFAGEELEQGRRRYRSLLTAEPARAALRDIQKRAARQHVTLLCFEHDDERCHRYVVRQHVGQLG